MAFCEVSQDQSPGPPAAAGDFGFKVLTASDPAEKTKKLSAELANGRLAMMAIIGMFFQATKRLHTVCFHGVAWRHDHVFQPRGWEKVLPCWSCHHKELGQPKALQRQYFLCKLIPHLPGEGY